MPQSKVVTDEEIFEMLWTMDTQTLDSYYAIEQERIQVQVLE